VLPDFCALLGISFAPVVLLPTLCFATGLGCPDLLAFKANARIGINISGRFAATAETDADLEPESAAEVDSLCSGDRIQPRGVALLVRCRTPTSVLRVTRCDIFLCATKASVDE
jgi:hypothetical protein